MEEMTVHVLWLVWKRCMYMCYGWYGRDDCTCVMAGMEEMTVRVLWLVWKR